VTCYADDGPVAFYLYDRASRTARFLFYDRPQLTGLTLAPMKPVTVRARDGEQVPCYLTLPAGVPAKRLPMVVQVHGGPWYRDEWGYDPGVQLLANRGYAVLQVNFRASSGFGQKWMNAGDLQFGPGAVLGDITDATRWAIREGIADPKRVAIMGGSFGGYATLCGLAFTPDLYACGVDIVGPSNLKTLIESFPPYWAARRQRWINRMGNVIENDSLNRALSPMFHAARIRAPLLIGHGANDPRATLPESEQMVKALREARRDVTFVVYPNEGHGFAREENATDFSGRMETFLAKHLGGRAQPEVKVEGTTAEVR
jgi:dipeptidyl aminopeptidase/acylaminoacyl peptidase